MKIFSSMYIELKAYCFLNVAVLEWNKAKIRLQIDAQVVAAHRSPPLCCMWIILSWSSLAHSPGSFSAWISMLFLLCCLSLSPLAPPLSTSSSPFHFFSGFSIDASDDSSFFSSSIAGVSACVLLHGLLNHLFATSSLIGFESCKKSIRCLVVSIIVEFIFMCAFDWKQRLLQFIPGALFFAINLRIS